MDTFCTGMHLSENLTLFVWALRDLDVRTWGKHEFLPTGYLISRNRFCPITGYFLRNFLEISEFSPCPSHHVKYSFRTPSRTLTYYVLTTTRLWTRNFRATLGLSRAYRNFSINFRESLTHTKWRGGLHRRSLRLRIRAAAPLAPRSPAWPARSDKVLRWTPCPLSHQSSHIRFSANMQCCARAVNKSCLTCSLAHRQLSLRRQSLAVQTEKCLAQAPPPREARRHLSAQPSMQ